MKTEVEMSDVILPLPQLLFRILFEAGCDVTDLVAETILVAFDHARRNVYT